VRADGDDERQYRNRMNREWASPGDHSPAWKTESPVAETSAEVTS